MSKIFLDHNSTTNMLAEVKASFLSSLEHAHNPSSIHYMGRIARNAVNNAKSQILESLSADPKIYEVIFTASGTESNNIIIRGTQAKSIALSTIEHDSVHQASIKLAHQFINVNDQGFVDLEEIKQIAKQTSEKTLVSIIHANNETGVIQDIDLIADILEANPNIIFHSDASQSYGKVPVSIEKGGLDLLTLTAHKMGGPQGISAIVKKKSVKLEPFIYGGGQEFGIRPGTENVAAIIAFGKAAEMIKEINQKFSYTAMLRDHLEKNLKEFSRNIMIVSEDAKRLPNTSSIYLNGLPSDLTLIKMDMNNIAISAGSACSSGKIEPSRVISSITRNSEIAKSTIRVSFGINNTKDELDQLLDTCKKILNSENKMRA